MPRITQRTPDSNAFAALSGLPVVLRRIYAARGVRDKQDLELGLSGLLPFQNLKGINQAAYVLQAAVTENKRILIVGDFDADGATSSALAVRLLRSMGARYVDYLVPNRFEFGYGLTPEIVEVAKSRSPHLIVTVDNGISSLAGVTVAKQSGIKVLVTDHHLAGDELPRADAIVNPNQPGCEFAGKNTAGVGVIFYVMAALRNALRASNWFEKQDIPDPNIAEHLDLLALGTVADVVPLDRNNRILVEQGLRRIRAGKCCLGITALLQVSGKDPANLVASDLGFALGPRLNAAGRLEDMTLGIECLLADTPERASELARQLDSLNRSRRDIEADMKRQAMDKLAALKVEEHQIGMSLYDPDWHQGVIGILASRIKDRYHRPVIAFADAGNGDIKGSARSIKGFHIRDALDALAKKYPELLQKFGGHAMAAGLSIRKRDFAAFSSAFNLLASQQLTEEALADEIRTDGKLGEADMSMSLAQELRRAGPWGQGFPEPLFEGEFVILEQRLVGDKHLKLRLATTDSGQIVDAIAFFIDLEEWPNGAKKVKLVYRLEVNEFRGRQSLQLLAVYLQAVE